MFRLDSKRFAREKLEDSNLLDRTAAESIDDRLGPCPRETGILYVYFGFHCSAS